MTAPLRVDAATMTSKGQVLIPKAIRDAAGLVPGQAVRVALNDRGEAVVTPLGFGPGDAEERTRRMREGLLAIAGKYPNGQSTAEYLSDVRGDYEP